MAGSEEMFWRKFESMIAAGVLPTEVAASLAEEHEGTPLGAALAEVVAEVAAGADLRAAMAARESSFPPGGAGTESPVSPKFSELLRGAVAARASDVHVEGDPEGARVRFRIDGLLREQERLTHAQHRALVESIKRSSALDPTERELPQDGRIRMAVGPSEDSTDPLEVRVSVGPSIYGEAVCLRIIRPQMFVELVEKPELVLNEAVRDAVLAAAGRPYGLILVTGPTGCGKTTTQLTLVGSQLNENVKGVSIEDPVEMSIPGLQQIQIRPGRGLTYSSALRYALRTDPDILTVAELRDYETVAILLQAAATGHLVVAAMHANTAVDAIGRLIDIGVEPHVLAEVLIGVVGQRLVRKLDPDKAEAAPDDVDRLREILGDEEAEVSPRRGVDGAIRGRTPVQEYLEVTPEIRRLIHAKSGRDELLEAARKNGFKNMLENGASLVADGRVALSELLRACSMS